ncbi:MAG: GNAT family N-acetyltransferase [Pyrinomonadaceae bacterium]
MEQRESELNFINEYFDADAPILPRVFDHLLADGWRHFGTYFTRYNLGIHRDEVRQVLPLRVRLRDFRLSKSQTRVLNKNLDIDVAITAPAITKKVVNLFERHKGRFTDHVPETIYTFISRHSKIPTDLYQLTAKLDGKIIAVSFFDRGVDSVSAIYACFDPNEEKRSLGVFTMLKVIEWATSHGMLYYYPGYAYVGPSFYDYKKRFAALECYDWRGEWQPYGGQ